MTGIRAVELFPALGAQAVDRIAERRQRVESERIDRSLGMLPAEKALNRPAPSLRRMRGSTGLSCPCRGTGR